MQGLRSAHLAAIALALVVAVLGVACGAAATPVPAATPTKAPLAATATPVPTPTSVPPTATPTLAPTSTPVPPTPTATPTKPPPTATPAPTPTKPPPTTTPAPFQVIITNFALPNITAPTGTTIIWHNDDSVAHTVTSGKDGQFDGAGWDSPVLPAGQTFSLPLTKTGAFAYTCRIHPSLNSTVTVTQSGAPSFTLPAPGSGAY